MQSDRKLIEQIRERNTTAFEALFERYRHTVHKHLLGIVRDESAAEDVVQEVFLRVWTCAAQWDGRGELKSWLYRIATNLALNHLRTVHRRRQQPLEIPDDAYDDEDGAPAQMPEWLIDGASPEPLTMLERSEQAEFLWELVDDLPDEKREVVHLVYGAEMDIRQVADELGVPIGTVKSRLHYTLRRLAREWKELGIEWNE